MNKGRATVVTAFTLVVLRGIAGCADLEKCGVESCSSDQKIASNVQARLNEHTTLGAPDSITVQAINGVVYLYGEVDVGLERRTAEAEAKQVAGVTRVVNNIAVEQ
jgi:osmotically-inducible protein OsmY